VVTSLRIAALQNRAMLSQQEGADEEALADLDRALALTVEVRPANPQTFGAMAIDLHHRLTVLYRRGSRLEEALGAARGALQVAESLAGDEWGPFAALYVRAKMVLADLCFDAGQFSEGEDHLFEVIESVPELLDPVLSGIDAYLSLWALSDDALVSGGLPREEVGESLAELLATFDARSSDDALRAAVWARYDLLVNGQREAAEQIASSPPAQNADPRLLAVRRRLFTELGAKPQV
jgi:tetratricopeptide (TPR) repeat protein